MEQRTYRVMVVEPDDILRNALLEFLDICDDLQAAGSAVQGWEAVRLCSILKPDVMLVEFRLPDMDGVELVRQLRAHCPTASIVVLTAASWDHRMREAIEAGATGWLEKGVDIHQITRALRLAAQHTLDRQL